MFVQLANTPSSKTLDSVLDFLSEARRKNMNRIERNNKNVEGSRDQYFTLHKHNFSHMHGPWSSL
jgi:hypothetical protein